MSISSGDNHLQHKEPFQFVERDMTSVFLGDQPDSIFHKVSKTCVTEVPLSSCRCTLTAQGLEAQTSPFSSLFPWLLTCNKPSTRWRGHYSLPPPPARGHSTKSHAVPQSSHCISPWPLCFDQCIHYSLGKVCKDPAQHPEAQLT